MKKVITYGSFDLFHEGHYKLLKRAKELGDYLIVGVTTEHFDTMRGKLNLVDPIMTRIENVRATGFADEIIVEDHDGQKIEDIQKYGVDVFTVGSDWTGRFDYLNAYCKVIYLERTPDISSSIIREGRGTLIRIGIIGTGRVAPRFFEESSYVSGAEVVAAYNPDVESAMDFNQKYQLPTYVENFDEFLDKVDAIYVASPNETHADYVRKGLEAGKHVLCEKPMTFTFAESQDLYNMATTKPLPCAVSEFERIIKEAPYNPSSPHYGGQLARNELENARSTIADIFHVKPDTILFTSGASESAVLATSSLYRDGVEVIPSLYEHHAVSENVERLQSPVKHRRCACQMLINNESGDILKIYSAGRTNLEEYLAQGFCIQTIMLI